MNDIKDEELSISIPLSSFYDSFLCPICLSEITDCYITECGHLFCNECVRECLNRKHKCPLCQMDTTVERLIKNHHFDRMFERVNAQKEKQSHAQIDHLLARVQKDISSVPTSTSSSSTPSPIDTIFRSHLSPLYTSYQSYYDSLITSHIRQKLTLRSTYMQQMEQVSAKLAVEMKTEDVLDVLQIPNNTNLARSASAEAATRTAQQWHQEYQTKLAVLERQHEKAVQLLIQKYQEYMQNLPPSPFLQPLPLIILLPATSTRGELRIPLTVRMTDSIADLRTLVIDQCTSMGHTIVKWNDDVKWSVKRVNEMKQQSLERIMDPTLCFAELNLHPHHEIVLSGTIAFKDDLPAQCFIATYRKDQEQRVDYYKCQECGFNWICSSCATNCHAGHTLTPFMMQHKPSWACCYCVKKKTCKIDNKPRT